MRALSALSTVGMGDVEAQSASDVGGREIAFALVIEQDSSVPAKVRILIRLESKTGSDSYMSVAIAMGGGDGEDGGGVDRFLFPRAPGSG